MVHVSLQWLVELKLELDVTDFLWAIQLSPIRIGQILDSICFSYTLLAINELLPVGLKYKQNCLICRYQGSYSCPFSSAVIKHVF